VFGEQNSWYIDGTGGNKDYKVENITQFTGLFMKNNVCWIDVIGYNEADECLKKIYDGVRNPSGGLDNLYQAFSLRPHTIKPADDLYLAALHHDDNSLPKWLSELIGSYVAIVTGCTYALTHHGKNFCHLYEDKNKAIEILENLKAGNLENFGNQKEACLFRYVKKLCISPDSVSAEDLEVLSDQHWSDGEILEVIQIVAMFSYFVRVINGTGISLHGETTGLY
jgi:uncharacterized peroxidase-related enzyme